MLIKVGRGGHHTLDPPTPAGEVCQMTDINTTSAPEERAALKPCLFCGDPMEWWGGMRLAAGDSDAVMQARFYHRFAVDCFTAQGLAERAALELRDEINVALG